jgi:hypothetical protein
MPADRYVHFKDESPTNEEVRMLLEDYFSGLAEVKWSSDAHRFFCTVVGDAKWAVNRIFERRKWKPKPTETFDEPFNKRVIEVYLDTQGKYVDVMTRFSDEITAGMAERLAELFAVLWKGRRDPV